MDQVGHGETEDSVTHPWHPCPEPEARQGRRGGKDHGVQTGKIRFSSDREECDISVTVLIICTAKGGEVERWKGGEVGAECNTRSTEGGKGNIMIPAEFC